MGTPNLMWNFCPKRSPLWLSQNRNTQPRQGSTLPCCKQEAQSNWTRSHHQFSKMATSRPIGTLAKVQQFTQDEMPLGVHALHFLASTSSGLVLLTVSVLHKKNSGHRLFTLVIFCVPPLQNFTHPLMPTVKSNLLHLFSPSGG